jgi:FlaA1/EpsC-like NDP-sugar epimerase
MLARNFSGCDVIAMDVVHIESVRDIVTEVAPDIVIHAAATKFVDVSERYPMEAVDVNVTGSQNVARVCIEKGVRMVLGISTDKASPPVRNTYGLTKALMERMFVALNAKSETRFCVVRYGNVAWSTGSVLCLWKKMVDAGHTIGTTGPDMYRYFFTVDEAVGLVRRALDNPELVAGKVLAAEMKAAQIRDLLDAWGRLAGVGYEQIAGRPGERDEEYLIGEQELPFTTALELGGRRHYLISFNQRVAEPAVGPISSRHAARLSPDEMAELISNPPLEEL